MSRLKNHALRSATEYLCDRADDFYATYQIGNELEEIGRLIKLMAQHIKNLQDKVDGQAEHIRALLGRNDQDKTCNGCFGASFNDCEVCDEWESR